MAYFLRHVPRHAAGAILFEENGREQQQDTLQCVHCQMHWVVEPGSGRRRGWCFKCHGPSCGARRCTVGCVPWEKAMEEREARFRLDRSLERIRDL